MIMDDIIVAISCAVGFTVYLIVGHKIMRGAQVREGGESCVYLIPAGAIGAAVGVILYFVIKAFQ